MIQAGVNRTDFNQATNLTTNSKCYESFDYYTMRKSGSTLMVEILKQLNMPADVVYPHKHLDLLNVEKIDPKKNYVILVRDPRDALRSLSDWAINPKQVKIAKEMGKFNAKKFNFFKGLTRQQRVNYYVNSENGIVIYSACNTALKLKKLKSSKIHFIKYEDLAGTRFGGSSMEVQKKAFEIIASLTNPSMKIDQQFINRALGGTATFTPLKKKVSSWKEFLTVEDAKTVQRNANEFLLEFGYETDPNWAKDFEKEKASIESSGAA